MIYELALSGKSIYIEHSVRKRKQEHANNEVTERMQDRRAGFHCTVYDEQLNPFSVQALGSKAPTAQRGFTLLSRVCRQLYQETATLAFKYNIVAFKSESVLDRYIMKERRLSLPLRRAVRRLYVQKNRPSKTLEKYLGGLLIVYVDTKTGVLAYNLRDDKATKLRKSEEEIQYLEKVDMNGLMLVDGE